MKKTPVIFEIRIETCQDFTWQGTLTKGGDTMKFRSELELLYFIGRLLPESGDGSFADASGIIS